MVPEEIKNLYQLIGTLQSSISRLDKVFDNQQAEKNK
jgi:hypothetical protein